jgi:hypothetical protein
MKYNTDIPVLAPRDVAIAGAGIAGVMAALAAAREGVAATIIEGHAFVGGQATAGGVHGFCGESQLVNDVWREMLSRLEGLDGLADYRPNVDGRSFDIEVMKLVLQEMLTESGVQLFLHTQVVDVIREGNAVSSLVIHNKSGLQALPAKQVIDTTGDADVAARGGWTYLKGGPSFKPGTVPELDTEAGVMQLPMSLYFTMVDTGNSVKPILPDKCPSFRDDEDVPMITVLPREGRIMVKMKVVGFDVTRGKSLSDAEQEARRQMMGVVYHLQTKGYRGTLFSNYRLAWSFPHIGIREGRRIVGEYVLKAIDALDGCHHKDAVAVGSYHSDYHWPLVLQRAGTGITTQCPPYQIPFRSMRPEGSRNLTAPGRSLSGEQMAMSSFRVMGICAQTGFAAGIAAAMAVREGKELDDLDQSRLRSRLREYGARLDLAPYNTYLRKRRNVRERIDESNNIGSLSIALVSNGDVLVTWTAKMDGGWVVKTARRHEERWLRTETLCTGSKDVYLHNTAPDRLVAGTGDGKSFNYRAEADAIEEIVLRSGRWLRRSFDGGQTWSKEAEQVASESATQTRLYSFPGDPEALCRSESGGFAVSTDKGETWKKTVTLEDCSERLPPVFVPSANGAATAFVRNDGNIEFRRVHFEMLLGEPDTGPGWLHNSRSWLDLIETYQLEPLKDR